MQLLQITYDDKIEEIDKKINTKNIIDNLNKLSKSKGSDKIKLLYEWKFNKSKIICYGWTEGLKCFLNKHKLPPHGVSKDIDDNSSSVNLYGDIFILKKNKNFTSINISEYGEFYNYMFDNMYDSIIDDENDDILINPEITNNFNEEDDAEENEKDYDNYYEEEDCDEKIETNEIDKNDVKEKYMNNKKECINYDNELEEDTTDY